MGNHIKQRSKAKLNNEYVQEFLLQRKSRCGAVALWMMDDEKGACVYEYLDEGGLDRLFREKGKQGVLQALVDPKGEYNHTIRSIWGTRLCFFEKYVNKNKFDDAGVDMYQRILTYEIEAMQQETSHLIGTVLTQRLESQAACFVNHIQTLTHDQFCVTRLVLNYRIDEQDKLWLLGCTSIRVKDKSGRHQSFKPVYDTNSKIQLPTYLDLKRLALQNQATIALDQQCQKCDKRLNRNELYPIRVKDIVESWNFDHIGQTNTYEPVKKRVTERKRTTFFSQLRRDHRKRTISPFNQTAGPALTNDPLPGLPLEIDKNYRIPDLIRKLMPRIKEKRYLEYLHNPTFMEIQVDVCQECFIKVNKGVNVKEDLGKMAHQEKLISRPFEGIGGLKPTQTRKRFEATRKDIINKERQQFEDSTTLRYQTPSTSTRYTTIHRKKVDGVTSLIFRDLSHRLFQPVLQTSTSRLLPNQPISYPPFEGGTPTSRNVLSNPHSRKSSMADLKVIYQ